MSETTRTTKSCLTVDLDNYENFIETVKEDPEQAKFQFSVKTQWEDGTITRTVARDWEIYADEPEALGGKDSAVDPVEYLLASLTSCVSIGLVTQAARRGVDFEDFEIEVTGDLDLRGYLGLDDNVRPGYTNLDYTIRVKSDADREVLEEIVQVAEENSPMYDNIQNGVPITSRLEVVE